MVTDSGLSSSQEVSGMPTPAPPAAHSSTSAAMGRTTHHTSPKPERKLFSPEKEETRRESLIRYCPPQAYKFFMEQHIENIMKEWEQRKNRRITLERELMREMRDDPNGQATMRLLLQKKETNYLRMKRAKLNVKDFKKIKKIGSGAFGEVSLVRSINSVNGRPCGFYAMKKLRKSQVVKSNQVAHVIAEKDILAEADNDWIVKLFYSFQV